MLPASRDGQALLRAVLCAPDDDAPRLILADWLDEHGEGEHADLIRRMAKAPSYTFTWTRHAKHGRHTHEESRWDIRGLRARLALACDEEWLPRPDVRSVIVRRGFAEAITMDRARTFLRTAIELFGRHPIQSVGLRDLGVGSSFEGDEYVEATLVNCDCGWDRWPAVLFPECRHRRAVVYRNREEAMADLSRHACAYGRRLAMVRVEPPPVPGSCSLTAGAAA